MKSLLGFVFLAIIAAAPAANARERFEGHFQIISKTGSCPNFNPVGERAFANYRPANIADNGPDTRLGIFFQNGARGFRVAGRVNVGANAAFKNVFGVIVFDGPDVVPGQQMRFISQDPPVVNATTRVIVIVGEIRRFEFMPNCTVRFQLTVQKQQGDLP